MRIGIDARFYGSKGKGLGRYTQKLIENLEDIDNINEFFIFLRRDNFKEYQPKNPNFKKVLADFRWYTFSEQFKMPKLLKKYNLDLVHFPHFNVPIFYRRPFVITIHDLILLHFPTLRATTLQPLYYWIKYLAYKIVIKSAIKRARKIIAVSNFTKKDILSNYSIPENKVAVTYEACDSPPHQFHADHSKKINNQTNRTLNISEINDNNWCGGKKYGIIKPCLPAGRPYILYVGNAYPHKNLEALVLGFKSVIETKPELNLVLVGKEDYFYRRLKKFVLCKKIKNVIFADFVSDNDLDCIYGEAELYIFPSLYEGFGLPPLEAMARGAPVASSDHPCMKEILEDSAYYFDAKRPEDIAKAIEVLDDQELRKRLIEKGYRQIKKYSWEKMAKQTLEIYKNF